MRAALILATFSLVAGVQAKYELSCAKSELSIRWPSYESNSEYYVCSRLFGRQMTVTCNPGEVFTFVLQSCTSPNRYIPAPALKVLPTASPLLNKPNTDGHLKPIEIPKDTPVAGPPVIDMSLTQPPIKPATYPMSPVVVADVPKQQEIAPVHKEENVVVVEQPSKHTVPLPPTPPPTPPVVAKESTKKPSSASGKKPTAKKKKSTTSDATTHVIEDKPTRKPSNASGKRPPPKKSGKQSSKVDKAPKKSAKQPKAAIKKSPKASHKNNI